MQIKRYSASSCCGRKSTILEINKQVNVSFVSFFSQHGFVASDHFTKSGMLFIESNELIVNSSFGSNKLNVKCKTQDCDNNISKFEALLNSLG